ncbi:MAG TPA: c-type cytochrome domain-containing protein [Chitinophagaceae bacterium]
MLELIGHLHPALVHLPIGILLIGLLMQWLARKEKYSAMRVATPIILLCGAITALFSCITGYILSTTDDYDKTLVTWHMWMGIGTALVSFMLYAKEKNSQFAINKKLLSIGLLVLVFVTGHLGGSLTHGSDYYTKPLANIFSHDTFSAGTIKPIPNAQEALAYSDVVRPILQTKCYGCHGPNKQKGGLRMDDSIKLMKGGKDGIVIEPGKADASEIIKRLILPLDDDDHMPPKEKSQPSSEQIALIHWWIDNGADLSKKVKELNQPDKIKPVLLALQKAPEIKHQLTDVPATPVEKANDAVLTKLRQDSIIVLPVAQNSNYLSANFVTDSSISNEILQLLLQLKKQLVWLNLANTNIDDASLSTIAQLTNLVRLHLENTRVTDKGLQRLQSLSNLRYLNLVGTKITAEGVMQLKGLKKLQSLYLYQTNIDKKYFAALRTAFSKTQIDTGGYYVPTLASDTTEVKVKKEY